MNLLFPPSISILVGLTVISAYLLACLFLGKITNQKYPLTKSQRDENNPGLRTIEGSLFALLGLLLAFTFTGAAGRYDERRALIVQEVNAIGTAFLRIDLLPTQNQAELRNHYLEYVKTRVDYYENLSNSEKAQSLSTRTMELQNKIWKSSTEGVLRSPVPNVASQALNPLNEMIDLVTTRDLARKQHPPGLVYAVLFLIAGICSYFAGLGIAGEFKKNSIHILGYTLVIAGLLYLILDFEYPRIGVIQLSEFDTSLRTLLDTLTQMVNTSRN